ncbi:MAG TPA: hypothetical protein VGL13_05825, partial [Polyangiaceae bacterium]
MMRFVEAVRGDATNACARLGLALAATLMAFVSCSSQSSGPTGTGGSVMSGTGGGAGTAETGGMSAGTRGATDGSGGSGDTGTGGSGDTGTGGTTETGGSADSGPGNNGGSTGTGGGAAGTGDAVGTGGAAGAGGSAGGDASGAGGDDGGTMGNPETGRKMLFSFDIDTDFNLCTGGAVLPPCWVTSIDELAGVTGGSFVPIADEAMTGHLPTRAAVWTSTFQNYAGSNRLVATFLSNEDWSRRKHLHFSLKVKSGLASVLSFDLFVQGGIEVNYAPIYQFHSTDDLTAEAGSSFVDLGIDFTAAGVDMTV